MLITGFARILIAVMCIYMQMVLVSTPAYSEELPTLVATVPMSDDPTFGGISGIDFDSASGLIYAISDDRSRVDKARFYTFSLSQDFRPLEIKTHFLFDAQGRHFAPNSIDPESIRFNQNGAFVWSSEIAFDNAVLFLTSLDTTQTQYVPVPRFMLPTNHTQKVGSVPNKGIEGVTFSHDKRHLFIAFEAPLAKGSDKRSKYCTIAILNLSTGKLIDQFYYQPDLVVHQATAPPFMQDNGISEILLLNETTLLVLERAGRHVGEGKFEFSNKLYEVLLPGKASMLSGNERPTVLNKKLYIDFDNVEFGTQSNLEAMTLVKRGDEEYLVLASDNNFSPDQQNELIVFKVR